MSPPDNAECIFCRIIAGEVPAAVIFEDDTLISFCDAFPAGEGHALVIPKDHHRDIFEMPEDQVAAVGRAVKRLAEAQRKALEPDGVMVTQFNGAAAGQTVFHYHVHCVPRWAGTPLVLHGREQASAEAMAAMAERIRAALA